jgi:CelD/BcsL family acetyltransferase involved in cellulose biosynthesis
MPLHLSQITNAEQLAAIRPEWNAIAGDNPFLGWDWADTWWRHYESPTVRLLVLAVRDDTGQLVGLAPWCICHSVTRGRVLKFIGSNEICGDRLTILATGEHRAAVLQRIAQALNTELQHQWDLVELTGVELANADIAELATLAQHAGNRTHVRPDLNCWKIALPDSWETYLAGVSRSRRNRTRKFLKRTIEAGKAEHRVLAAEEDFEAFFRTLVELHQKRRISIGEPGCFASAAYYNFHHEFARRMFAQQKLRLVVLYMQGQPAAVEYGFLGDGTIYHYQCGFDPALADAHPGWISLASTLRWAIEAGYHTLDMLRGDEPYKASFGAQPMPLVQTRIVGCQRSARLRHLAWRTQAAVKRWARETYTRANRWRGTEIEGHNRQSDALEQANATD